MVNARKYCFQIGTWLSRKGCVVVTYNEETFIIVNRLKEKKYFSFKNSLNYVRYITLITGIKGRPTKYFNSSSKEVASR